MGSTSEVIEQYYDREFELEWERLERHRTELAVTMRALDDYLPPPPARVLDCGGGPGRYAIALARRGYDVTLFDLSAENLALAQKKASKADVHLAACQQGTATDLSCFSHDTFDAALLMGPLYHLLEAPKRRQTLEEARRVLKPGVCSSRPSSHGTPGFAGPLPTIPPGLWSSPSCWSSSWTPGFCRRAGPGSDRSRPTWRIPPRSLRSVAAPGSRS